MKEMQHKEVFKDYIPANARIAIDYTKPKPNVVFSYPIKYTGKEKERMIKKAVIGTWSMLVIAFSVGFTILLIAFGAGQIIGTTAYIGTYFMVHGIPPHLLSPPSEPKYVNINCISGLYCAISSNHSKLLNVLFLNGDGINSSLAYYLTPPYGTIYHTQSQAIMYVLQVLGLLIGIMLFFSGVPRVIYLLIKKDKKRIRWFTDFYPKLNYWVAKVIRRESTIRLDKNSVNGNSAYIYDFNNVSMKYNATKDFSRNLQKIQILEFPWSYKWMRKRKTKTRKQDSHWVCRFVFSKSPKEGYIDVTFI